MEYKVHSIIQCSLFDKRCTDTLYPTSIHPSIHPFIHSFIVSLVSLEKHQSFYYIFFILCIMQPSYTDKSWNPTKVGWFDLILYFSFTSILFYFFLFRIAWQSYSRCTAFHHMFFFVFLLFLFFNEKTKITQCTLFIIPNFGH